MNEKVNLIVKLGATGDVVRTTSLLNILGGTVDWLTTSYNRSVLPTDCPNLGNIWTIDDREKLKAIQFDKIYSLEEDKDVLDLIATLSYKSLSGLYLDQGIIKYTPDSNTWFNMSLVSTKGKRQADLLKWQNRKSFQEMMFEMAGRNFNGEPYLVWKNTNVKQVKGRVGVEKRVGDRWPGKQWWGYDQLCKWLEEDEMEVFIFHEKPTLHQYMEDIASCEYVITGDTLAMHVALAYGITIIGIFTCTAPWEIYDYNLLHKITTPLLEQSFYHQMPVLAAIESIPPEQVFARFKKMRSKGS